MTDNRHLAELFGLVKNDLEISAASTVAKRKGRTAEESARFGAKALEEGDPVTAAEHFSRAAEQSGHKDPRIEVDLATALDLAGKEEEAEALLANVTQEHREDAEAKVALGETYRRQARFREAIDQFERAIAKDPSNASYHFKLSETLRDQRSWTDAVFAAERAALAEPQNPFYHFWLGDLLIEMRRFDDALVAMEQAVNLSPGDDFFYLRTAVAFWGAGKKAEAIKATRLASELAPENGVYQALLVVFLRKNGETDPAIADGAALESLDAYDQDRLSRILDFLGE